VGINLFLLCIIWILRTRRILLAAHPAARVQLKTHPRQRGRFSLKFAG
jgi:hypothetical protein